MSTTAVIAVIDDKVAADVIDDVVVVVDDDVVVAVVVVVASEWWWEQQSILIWLFRASKKFVENYEQNFVGVIQKSYPIRQISILVPIVQCFEEYPENVVLNTV